MHNRRMSLKLLSILKIIFGGQKGIYVTLISIPSTPTHRISYHVAYKFIFTTISYCDIHRAYEKSILDVSNIIASATSKFIDFSYL